jgi:penicillin amidase
MAWREIRDRVLAVQPQSADQQLALALLRGWNGRLEARSAAASVYELLVAELAAALVRDVAPSSWRWAMGAGFGPVISGTSFGARTVSRLVRQLRDHPDPSPQIQAALDAAITALTAARGRNPGAWAWGEARPLRLRHVLGAVKAFERAFNLGPVAVGGDTNTVAQAGARPLDPLGPHGAIANHRMVVDLGDPERSRYVVAGGQSGNPLSPHYGDLFALWTRGEGIPIAWSAESVRASVVDRLTIVPDRPEA